MSERQGPPSGEPPAAGDPDVGPGGMGAGVVDARDWEVPWAGARSLLDVLVIYVGAQILPALVAVVLASTRADPDALLPVLVAVSPVASLAVTFTWLAARYDGWLRPLAGRRPPRAGDLGIGVAVGIVCLLGQRLVVLVIATLAERLGVDLPVVQQTFREIAQRPGALPLFVVTTVLLAPVAEEVVFRGVLFQGLRSRAGFWVAALVSAALFTVPHLFEGGGLLAGVIISSGILPLGIVFAALVERRGSLLPAVVAHATYNAIGVATLILLPGAV